MSDKRNPSERGPLQSKGGNPSLNFYDCLMECAGNAELVKEFDRLRGCNLSMKGSPISLMVDEATGKQKDDLLKFIAFCWECIWLPLPLEARHV